MLLVDSSVWIDFFNGVINPQTDYLYDNLGIKPVYIGDIILAEVLQGFNNDNDYQTAKSIFKTIPVLNLCNEYIAIKSSEYYRYLRQKGITVRKTIDCIIATYCIENNVTLLHRDKDFDCFQQYFNLLIP